MEVGSERSRAEGPTAGTLRRPRNGKDCSWIGKGLRLHTGEEPLPGEVVLGGHKEDDEPQGKFDQRHAPGAREGRQGGGIGDYVREPADHEREV